MSGARSARIAVAVVLAAMAACSDDVTDPASINSFSASMNGANEKPTAVSTTAAGNATMSLSGLNLTYTVNITSAISNVTQAHIHTGGPAGPPGPIAAWLCGTATNPGPDGTPVCGSGAVGQLITGTVAITEALASSMRGFGAYTNVHTTANTGGEIRGNIVGAY